MDGLDTLLATGAAGFLLAFARIGSAVMIMPALGDSFAPAQVRLLIALAMTAAFFPLVAAHLPATLPAEPLAILPMIFAETVVGLLFGTVARIAITALDTAGMIIAIQSGLGSAQLFNPAMASQGSVVGAALSISGVVLLFATNLHHILILGVLESYSLFPIGVLPDSGSMAETVTRAVAASFALGVALAGPFLASTLILYAGMGVLTRLMPQMQVFLLALPAQLLFSLALLAVTLGAILTTWAAVFADTIHAFLGG